MKVTVTQDKSFHPITMTITLTSAVEAHALYAMVFASSIDIAAAITAGGDTTITDREVLAVQMPIFNAMHDMLLLNVASLAEQRDKELA